MPIPKYDDLFNPLLQAVRNLGGSASVAEQEDEVATILKLTDAEVSEIHRGNRTKLSYRLAWARNYLKRYGALDNSSRGVWALTSEGQKHQTVNKDSVKKFVQSLDRDVVSSGSGVDHVDVSDELKDIDWEDKLLAVIKAMQPDAFERLCQRLLRESGFIQVEVTGKQMMGE